MIPKSFTDQFKPKQSSDKQNLMHGHRYLCRTKDDIFHAWYDDFDDCFIRENNTTYGVSSVEWEYFEENDFTKGQLEFLSWVDKYKLTVDRRKTSDLVFMSVETRNLYKAYRAARGLIEHDHDLLVIKQRIKHPEIYTNAKYKGD